MSLNSIRLPRHINANGLLPFLALLCIGDDVDAVEIDFAGLQRVSPAGLAALVAAVTGWQRQGISVSFLNLDFCVVASYLYRMGVFEACGVSPPDGIAPQRLKGRYVPVQPIEHPVEAMGNELAACLAPEENAHADTFEELYDLAWYVFTEVANNVRQHSLGRGYVAAQVNHSEGLIRIAIADNGKGIRQSFVDAGLDWASAASCEDSILRALQPKVSSKGSPTNEGVGLTLVSGLVRQTNGWLLVVSGDGFVQLRPGHAPEPGKLPGNAHFRGTLVVTAFRQEEVLDFARLLHDAKIESGLLQAPASQIKFRA